MAKNKTNSTKYKQRKTRDSDCCSINFVKYVLHIFNVIFFLCGIGVTGVSIWTIFWKHQYISLLDTSNYAIGTYALLVAGCLGIIGGFLGCGGVWREHRAIILYYIFLLLIVFLLEAIVGGLAYVYENNISNELNETLNNTFLTNYGIDETKTKAIDDMQQNYQCCGALRFEDWQYSVWKKTKNSNSLIVSNSGRLVPDSCCITMIDLCGARDHPSNIPYTGCIYTFTKELRYHLNILAAIGSGICVVQIFGMVLACLLYVKLKYVDDEVQ